MKRTTNERIGFAVEQFRTGVAAELAKSQDLKEAIDRVARNLTTNPSYYSDNLSESDQIVRAFQSDSDRMYVHMIIEAFQKEKAAQKSDSEILEDLIRKFADQMDNPNWVRAQVEERLGFKTTTNEEAHHEPSVELEPSSNPEPEDFEKTFTISSGQFAIVDASLVRGLQVPGVEDIIMVPTKISSDDSAEFKVTAEYDDAVLRKLEIKPVTAESSELIPDQDQEKKVEEQAITGHDKPMDKKIRKHTTIKGLRRNRNKLASKKGGKAKIPDPISKLSHKRSGAGNKNFGQIIKKKKKKRKKSKITEDVISYLKETSNKSLSSDQILQMEDKREIRAILAKLMAVCTGQIAIERIHNLDFDLVYEAWSRLNDVIVDQTPEELEELVSLVDEGIAIG